MQPSAPGWVSLSSLTGSDLAQTEAAGPFVQGRTQMQFDDFQFLAIYRAENQRRHAEAQRRNLARQVATRRFPLRARLARVLRAIAALLYEQPPPSGGGPPPPAPEGG